MKRPALIVFLVLVLVAGVVWAIRRSPAHPSTAPNQPAAAASAPRAPQSTSASGPGAVLVRSERARLMAAAYEAGALPAPLAIAAPRVEVEAEELAAAVAAGNASSTAALVAAVRAAGFDIRGDDGRITRAAEGRSQGIAIDAWQIAATAKLYGQGYGIGLDRLAAAIDNGIPALHDAPLADLVLQGLRAGAKSPNDALNFWSHFVSELGRRAPAPFDLLAPAGTTAVRLDPVQVLFIVTRLVGDLGSLAHAPGSASVRPPAVLPWVEVVAYADTPCGNYGDVGGVITDYAALGSTTGFAKLAEYLKAASHIEGMAAYAERAGQANVLLTVLKFLGTYAALDVKLEMQGGALVRTKTTQPGDRREVTATVTMTPGKWQAFNCVRQVLNLSGLDFNLPTEGPVPNVKVTWTLNEGGGPSGFDAVVDTATHLKEILSGKGDASDYHALIYIDAPQKGPAMDGIDYTDANGQTRTFIVGMPQSEDLTYRKTMPVHTRGSVSVYVQVKPTRLKDKTTTAGTIGDMAGSVVSGLTGDFLGLATGLTTESLYRSQWYQTDPYVFEVTDWDPCHGAWTGTVTEVREYNKVEDLSGPIQDAAGNVHGQQKRTHTRVISERTEYVFLPNGKYADSIVKAVNTVHALDRDEYSGHSDLGCAFFQGGQSELSGVQEKTDDGGARATGDGDVNESSDGTASIGFHQSNAGKVMLHEFRVNTTTARCRNGQTRTENFGPSEVHSEYSKDLSIGIAQIKIDPKHPDELRGSSVTTESDGTKVTRTWDLARCR